MHTDVSVANAPNAVEKHRRYLRMVDRIRGLVAKTVPPGATVLVISKGDDELLALGSIRAAHFPQAEDGRYRGFYPKTSEDAIAQLEKLRESGAEYLLIPATAMWWLEHYAELGKHLELRYRRIAGEQETCVVFRLREPVEADRADPTNGDAPRTVQLESLVTALLPADAATAIATSEPVSKRYVRWSPPSELRGEELARSISSNLSALAETSQFLVVPAGLNEHVERPLMAALERRFRFITDQGGVCSIFRLSPTATRRTANERSGRFAQIARVLFPPGSTVATTDSEAAAAVESAGSRSVAFTGDPTNGNGAGDLSWPPGAEFIVLRMPATGFGSARELLDEDDQALLLLRGLGFCVYARARPGAQL